MDFTKIKIGILGGGQLARMMCLSAHKLGIKTFILSEDKNDPAAQVSHLWVKGDIYSEKDLVAFLQHVDYLTFESEFINVATVKKAIKAIKHTKVFPKLRLMQNIQDRWLQKKLIQKYNLPTSEFIKVSQYKEAVLAIDSLGLPFVLKQRHHGYDGYGTFIIKTKADLKKIEAKINDCPFGFIAEKFIAFKRELAISAFRDKTGNIEFYPLVETFQQDSKCLWVKGPVKHLKLAAIKSKIKTFLNKENYIGAIAVELFDHANNLLINELAPRVHNSAHYSQEAMNYDQFILHLLSAITTLPKPKALFPGFSMHNLIASKNSKKAYIPLSEHYSIHWYGKQTFRPGRKMGHLNSYSTSADKALSQLKKLFRNKNMSPKIAIVMGSQSDMKVMQGAIDCLKEFGVDFSVNIKSAHRTPEDMLQFAKQAADNGIEVIIAGAGGAAHLPGMIASATTLPIIGVPVNITPLNGLDSLLSIVQMPKGVPVATMAIDNSKNAALYALRILALSNEQVKIKLKQFNDDQKQKVKDMDKNIQ